MKVKMQTTMASADGIVAAGSVVELATDTAQALIDGGFARAVVKPAPAVDEAATEVDGADEPATKALKAPAAKARKGEL